MPADPEVADNEGDFFNRPGGIMGNYVFNF